MVGNPCVCRCAEQSIASSMNKHGVNPLWTLGALDRSRCRAARTLSIETTSAGFGRATLFSSHSQELFKNPCDRTPQTVRATGKQHVICDMRAWVKISDLRLRRLFVFVAVCHGTILVQVFASGPGVNCEAITLYPAKVIALCARLTVDACPLDCLVIILRAHLTVASAPARLLGYSTARAPDRGFVRTLRARPTIKSIRYSTGVRLTMAGTPARLLRYNTARARQTMVSTPAPLPGSSTERTPDHGKRTRSTALEHCSHA